MNLRSLTIYILVFIAYFLSGKLGLQLASINPSATAVWAPTGIAISTILIFGKKMWPVIYLGAFFTNLATAGTALTSLGIATGNTLEGVVGAYLIYKVAGSRNVLNTPRGIFKFTLIILFACTLSATWGVSTLMLGGFLSPDDILSVWLTWWLGNISGAFMVVPLFLFWTKRYLYNCTGKRYFEAVFSFLAIVLVSGIIFNGMFLDIPSTLPLEYLCIPILVWISIRFDRREVIGAIILLAAIATWGTVKGHGPFSIYGSNYSLILLQAFLDVTTIMILSLSSVVAERKRVQRLFRSTLNNMREGFQIIGFDWKYLYTNKAVEIQGKRSEAQLHGKTMMEVYPGIENTNFFNHLKRCMVERIPHNMENEFVFPDGSKGWFGLRIEPVSEGVLVLSVDISEQKRVQAILKNEKAEDEALLNSIGDGMVATDTEGNIIMINNALVEMLGWTREELIGKYSIDKLPMEDERGKLLTKAERPIAKALKSGKRITAVNYVIRKDKTKFPALITATPVIQNKKITGGIKIFHDITKEREIDEMKTEFISLVSHELRTPLSAIKGFVSMINEGDYGKMDPKLDRPLKLVASSTDRLINIVNEMLDVSRIEANRLKLTFGSYIIQDLIDEVVANLKPLFIQKNIELKIEDSKRFSVSADREKVIEILNNLLGNALKFTEKGSISIKVAIVREKVAIFVTDTGLGIDVKDHAKLFNKFEQLKSKRSGNISGTGLGLYISREFARKMGGDLWIEKSEIGKGSVFALSLPSSDWKINKR